MDNQAGHLFDEIKQQLATGRTVSDFAPELWNRFGSRCAVVVIDSTGFTWMTEQLGVIPALCCIQQMRTVVSAIFHHAGCRVLRAEADNIFAEFANVQDALAACISARAQVGAAEWSRVGGRQYQICTGIGFGKVLNAGHEGVYGSEMNIASKLGEDIAEAGEILLSDAAFQALPEQHGHQFTPRDCEMSSVCLRYHQLAG